MAPTRFFLFEYQFLDTCRDIFLKVQAAPSVHKVLRVHDILGATSHSILWMLFYSRTGSY